MASLDIRAATPPAGRGCRSASAPRLSSSHPALTWRSASPITAPCHASTSPTSSCRTRSEEHTSELQSQSNLVCRLLLEKKKHLLQTTRGGWPMRVEDLPLLRDRLIPYIIKAAKEAKTHTSWIQEYQRCGVALTASDAGL